MYTRKQMLLHFVYPSNGQTIHRRDMGVGANECALENKTYDTLFTLATTLATGELYSVETWDLVQSIVHSKKKLTLCLP